VSELRLYEPEECTGAKGYPPAWHESIKHAVREEAGHRCVRCLHPYRTGESPPDWSPCDEQCRHHGPVRYRTNEGEWHVEPSKLMGWTTGDLWRDSPETARLAQPQAAWRILTVHHLDGNKGNCRWWNLVALCQRCHLEIQGKVKLERRWLGIHSDWFKPYVAGFYALHFLGQEVDRFEAEARMDELLALDHAMPL